MGERVKPRRFVAFGPGWSGDYARREDAMRALSNNNGDGAVYERVDLVDACRAEREGYRNGQLQVQVINDGLMESITKYAAERDRLRALLVRARDELRWCSGSEDFNEGGKARKGWMLGPVPLLADIEKELGE